MNEKPVFRFAAPVEGTGDHGDTWRPGATESAASGSLVSEEIYADPVITPVPPPFDRGLWPPFS